MPNVTVTGRGRGGRNMELALAFAMEIEGTVGITLLSAGTDAGRTAVFARAIAHKFQRACNQFIVDFK